MIYRNDNIEIKGNYVKGSIKHLKEFFDWCRETIRKYNKVVAING